MPRKGVILSDTNTNLNTVTGNVIGLNAAGTAAIGNGYAGVGIYGGASSNTIGGNTPAARNLISGNGNQGVVLGDAGTTGNVVSGNYIGVDVTGAAALGNAYAGVLIYAGAQANRIGGDALGAGNVISGNQNQGVQIAGANSNVVAGNLIGLDASGSNQIANTYDGVALVNGSQNNTIGATLGATNVVAPHARNYISGNKTYGMSISGSGTNGNLIQGNTIGLNIAGTAVPNTYVGISISGGAQNNQIGGAAAGAGNVISGNAPFGGVTLQDSTTRHNSIRQNSIYANGGNEIYLYDGSNNSLGAPTLTSAVLGLNTVVSGTLSGGAASTAHKIEFFATPAGMTGGKSFIGSVNVTTNSSGAASFSSVALPPKVPAGSLIVATARSSAGDTSGFSAARTVTTTDTDNDGIPDVYEIAHGLNRNSPADAALDSDGDGVSNLEEYQAGTDPHNASSILKVTNMSIAGSDVDLSFTTVANQLYRLESTTDLNAISWQLQLADIIGTGNVVPLTLTGAAGDSQRFFRLVADP